MQPLGGRWVSGNLVGKLGTHGERGLNGWLEKFPVVPEGHVPDETYGEVNEGRRVL